MKHTISLASLLLGVVLVIMAPGSDFPVEAAAQTPGFEPDKGVEVLGHGPIHEAFAQPALPTLEMSVVVNKQPPAPVEELPPDVKPEGDNVNWVPGYWAFDNERNDFIWISGFWRNMPPNRVWLSGYWAQDGNGYRWVPGYWSEASATQVYYPPPPEVIVEAPPPAPNDSSFYVAGTWVYRDTRYLWRPGYWSPYRPGWLWTQPRYSWTPGGYIFVDGYWDYDFGRRGVLFAPAYFGPGYFAANRYYRPSFALATNFLYASLFIQPSTGFYYFGDYYAPRYAGLGYTPWVDYRYRGQYADPAWSYYAWQNRGTPRWEQQMRASYTARERGEAPAPPRRIDTQAAAPAPSKQTDVNVAQNVNLVMPVQQLATQTGVKLRAVPKDEIATVQRQAGEARTLAKSRQTVESNADLKASRQQAVPVKLQLPKTAPTAFKGEQPPPPPVLPKLDAQAAPPKGKDPSNAPTPPIAPKTNDPTPKAKDATPKAKDPTPSPKVPVPPPVAPQKGKDQAPKSAPKTGVAPQAPPPPTVSPMPKATPPLPPKIEPKAIPTPKTTPPTAPPPKSLPPQPKPLEPKTLPAPLPKTAPPVNVPPAPQGPALVPKTSPPPVQKVLPPPPKNLPPAPNAPPQAPKLPPPTPKVIPAPGPALDLPPTPVRPDPSKGKGKDKEKD